MEKRRSTRRRRSSERVLMILLVAVVLIGCAVGGTIAYFTDTTDAVTNTFVVGDIGELELYETPDADNDSMQDGKYVIVPGVDITKDPKLTYVNAADEYKALPAYVFVKVETESKAGATASWTLSEKEYSVTIGSDKVIDWTVADGWNVLDSVEHPGVFYREVAADEKLGDGNDLTKGVSIIANNKINVSNKITMDTIDDVANVVQRITFTAYAIQKDGFADAAAAWTALNS